MYVKRLRCGCLPLSSTVPDQRTEYYRLDSLVAGFLVLFVLAVQWVLPVAYEVAGFWIEPPVARIAVTVQQRDVKATPAPLFVRVLVLFLSVVLSMRLGGRFFCVSRPRAFARPDATGRVGVKPFVFWLFEQLLEKIRQFDVAFYLAGLPFPRTLPSGVSCAPTPPRTCTCQQRASVRS